MGLAWRGTGSSWGAEKGPGQLLHLTALEAQRCTTIPVLILKAQRGTLDGTAGAIALG